MNFKVSYILLVCLTVLFSACDSLIYDSQEVRVKSAEQEDIYISISKVQIAGMGTINENTANFEDRVHHLALLTFNSSTGAKTCEYFENEISFSDKKKIFTVKLSTGQHDFYFVANMPMEALRAINNRSEMNTYISAFRDLDLSLYKEATESKAFPMSRVYLNQTITEGGNIYSPKPFRPVVDGRSEDRVELIRAVAKLEVILDRASINSGVKNIYYKNAYRQFTLAPDIRPATISYYETNALEKVGNSYICYMPEAMMMNTNPSWTTTNHKPINYFFIETLEGTLYQIPIITENQTIAETDYVTFATGKNALYQPDYNIYRNRHYCYLIKSLQAVEIMYAIEPWSIKQTSTYMGYGYNVSVSDDGKIRINNTVDVCSPYSIKMKTILPFTFNDGSVEKIFESRDIDAYAEYTLNAIPLEGDGDYLELYDNGTKVKTFSK